MEKQAKKHSYFKNILLIALADGEINTQERVFLDHLATKLGLSEEDHKYILKNINNIQFMVPHDREELMQQFRDILMIMVIDGKIHPKEYALVVEYGKRLGFEKELIDDMVNGFINSIS